MDEAEYEKVREAIMEKHGIDPYHRYGEEQAAHFVDIDLSTLKRWRAHRRVPAIRLGSRKVRYLGIHVADMMLGKYPTPAKPDQDPEDD